MQYRNLNTVPKANLVTLLDQVANLNIAGQTDQSRIIKDKRPALSSSKLNIFYIRVILLSESNWEKNEHVQLRTGLILDEKC